MKKDRLLEYCEKHKIAVPKGASVEYLERAICRLYFDLGDATIKAENCFGYYGHEESACMVCDFEEKCFEASIGMKKEEYFAKLEKLENPRIRFVKKKKRLPKTP